MTLADYPVIKNVEIRPGLVLPLVDIPMMSDEEWNRLARKNYHKAYLNGIEQEERKEKERHEIVRQVILETCDRDIEGGA